MITVTLAGLVGGGVQAEEAARAQMEYDEEHMGGGGLNPGGAGLKKSPSEASFASIELHLPRRRAGDGGGSGVGGGNAGGPGVMVDRECLSMKSDCGMDIRRRFSLVNATGKKVRDTKQSSSTLPVF